MPEPTYSTGPTSPARERARRQRFEQFKREQEAARWKRRHKKSGLERFTERFGSDIASTVHDAPRGLATFGKAAYDDWQAPMREAKAWRKAAERAKRRGRPAPPKPKVSLTDFLSFPRTRALGKATAGAFYEDLRHPLRHPGNTFLNVAGLALGGAGLGVKGSAALGAARGASKVRRLHVPRAAGRGLDPGRLGSKQMVKGLRKEQRGRNPLVAVARELGKKPSVPVRVAGGVSAVNLNARRQRAAREPARRRTAAPRDAHDRR